jgi:uncharacterized protein YqjF (DUF2071 family)
MYQRWENLLFLHWFYDPEVIQRTLPKGLHVDTFEGKASVGLVPIFLRNVRPRFVPAIPYVSDFLELNLRTYVYDDRGLPGVFFYSLSCHQRLVVEGARRILGLRYEHAMMEGSANAVGLTTLICQRPGEKAVDRFAYEPLSACTSLAEPGSLEFFLIERYSLFAGNDGELTTISVRHEPYRLGSVKISSWGEHEFTMARLPAPNRRPDHCCAAAPMDLEVLLPRTSSAAPTGT